MRVFVTGATGFVGQAVVRELISAGHSVLGLARSDGAVETLARLGAEAHRGELADTDSLVAGARACDGVIHTAFIHDFSKFEENCETDRRAIRAIGAALEGTRRPLIVTSGTALVASGQVAVEDDTPATSPFPRIASEHAAAAAAARGVHVSVVRLPPSVHGAGDHGFVPILIGLAREKGVSAYTGEGRNVWPAVHRFDAARVYRLAMEKAEARAWYHAAAEPGIPFRDIATAIGRGLNVPAASLTPEEAHEHFGWFAHFAAVDNPTSTERTRERLGWRPEWPDLMSDIESAGYFQG
jgi:nucleoside-diphosphate-sugar epimerase